MTKFALKSPRLATVAALAAIAVITGAPASAAIGSTAGTHPYHGTALYKVSGGPYSIRSAIPRTAKVRRPFVIPLYRLFCRNGSGDVVAPLVIRNTVNKTFAKGTAVLWSVRARGSKSVSRGTYYLKSDLPPGGVLSFYAPGLTTWNFECMAQVKAF